MVETLIFSASAVFIMLPKYLYTIMAAFLKSAEYMYACVFEMALDIQP